MGGFGFWATALTISAAAALTVHGLGTRLTGSLEAHFTAGLAGHLRNAITVQELHRSETGQYLETDGVLEALAQGDTLDIPAGFRRPAPVVLDVSTTDSSFTLSAHVLEAPWVRCHLEYPSFWVPGEEGYLDVFEACSAHTILAQGRWLKMASMPVGLLVLGLLGVVWHFRKKAPLVLQRSLHRALVGVAIILVISCVAANEPTLFWTPDRLFVTVVGDSIWSPLP